MPRLPLVPFCFVCLIGCTRESPVASPEGGIVSFDALPQSDSSLTADADTLPDGTIDDASDDMDAEALSPDATEECARPACTPNCTAPGPCCDDLDCKVEGNNPRRGYVCDTTSHECVRYGCAIGGEKTAVCERCVAEAQRDVCAKPRATLYECLDQACRGLCDPHYECREPGCCDRCRESNCGAEKAAVAACQAPLNAGSEYCAMNCLYPDEVPSPCCHRESQCSNNEWCCGEPHSPFSDPATCGVSTPTGTPATTGQCFSIAPGSQFCQRCTSIFDCNTKPTASDVNLCVAISSTISLCSVPCTPPPAQDTGCPAGWNCEPAPAPCLQDADCNAPGIVCVGQDTRINPPQFGRCRCGENGVPTIQCASAFPQLPPIPLNNVTCKSVASSSDLFCIATYACVPPPLHPASNYPLDCLER